MNDINPLTLKLQIRIAYLEAMLAVIACRCDADIPTSQLLFELKNLARAAVLKQPD